MDANAYALTAWGLKLRDLTLPSGQICQIKDSIDLTELIELGVYEELDSLGMIVDEDHIQRVKIPQDHKKKKKEEEKAQEDTWRNIVKDKSKFGRLNYAIDVVVLSVVQQPKLTYCYKENEETGTRAKIPLEDRVPELIYSDTVSFEDRMFIFESVTSGVSKMADFRKGSTETMGDVVDLPEPVDTSE